MVRRMAAPESRDTRHAVHMHYAANTRDVGVGRPASATAEEKMAALEAEVQRLRLALEDIVEHAQSGASARQQSASVKRRAAAVLSGMDTRAR